MEVFFLGTGAAAPTGKRRSPSIVIRRKGELIMLDAGEGTQFQLAKAKLGFCRPMKIIISHLHGDHVLGVPGLLQSMDLFERKEELRIYGPRNLKNFVEFHRKFFHIKTRFNVLIEEIEEGFEINEEEYRIIFFETKHHVPCFGVVIEEKMRRGKFNGEKADKLGLTPLMRAKLVKGETVFLDGEKIKPSDLIGPPRKGRKIVYVPDTRPFKGLIKYIENADLLIYNATFSVKDEEEASEKGHSTVKDLIDVLYASNVKLAVATHISNRYKDKESYLDGLIRVPSNMVTAEDFLKVLIPLPEKGGPLVFFP